MAGPAGAASSAPPPADRGTKKRAWRILQVSVSVGIAIAIFALVIPKVADYTEVWRTISALAVWKLLILVAVMGGNLVTYWPQQTTAMPGLTLAQAAVNSQTSNSIANVVPGGQAVAVAFAYYIYRTWGFTKAEIVLQALVTGMWNIYLKLAAPVVALAVLAAYGHFSLGLLVAASVGLAVLAASLVLIGFTLWKKAFARVIGAQLGRIASAGRRWFRKPPVRDWGEAAVGVRTRVIELLERQWIALTGFTVLSHAALFVVLLLSLRFVGVNGHQVSWAEVFGVFAFVRLLSTLPLTPGGIGIAELGYIGGLALAGGEHAKVVAAVLLFRALTYGLQIPLGGVTYVVWRRKRSWFKAPPDLEPAEELPGAVPALTPA